MCIFFAILFPIILFPSVGPICDMAGISQYEDLIAAYLFFPLSCISLAFFCNYFSSIMGSEADTKRSTIILITGNTVNFLLDPILIYYFKLGMLGAGLSTAIGWAVSSILFIYLFYIKSDTVLKLYYSNFHFDKAILKEIIVLAIPLIIETLIISLLGLLTNYALHLYAPPLAAYAYVIIFRVQMVVFTPIQGLSAGLYTVIGHLFGAKRFKVIKDTFTKFIGITFGLSIVIGILLAILYVPITSIFTVDYVVMAEVKQMLIFVIIVTLSHSILWPCTYAFLGLGKSQYLLYFIIYNIILFNICIFLLEHVIYLAEYGVLLSVCLSYIIEVITVVLLLNYHLNKLIKENEKDNVEN